MSETTTVQQRAYGPYGLNVVRSQWQPELSVIGEVELAPAGNIVLRVGHENEPNGPWSQFEHVVLTPDEAEQFAREILTKLGRVS